ncbi:MAG TPA: GNAT family N-acetyltransferase [Cryomorphaceae bacterium]|nr:GNAT family N-acetyltransferase [Cryomorphaceae bacterium]HKL39695.1 GNAT family N-acetyltransferase [Cryomorphaceae bacterium]
MTIQPQENQGEGFANGVFSSPSWCQVFAPSVQGLAIFKGKNPVAAFVLFYFKKYGKEVLIHPPFAPNCGLMQFSSHPKQYTKATELKRILRTFAEYLQKEHSDSYIDIALPSDIKDTQPFIQAGLKTDVGYTYLLNIEPDEDDLLANFSSERRKNVKDALKKKLSVEKDYNPDKVVARVQQTLNNSGINYNYDYLRRIIDGEFSYTISVISGNDVAATAVIVFDSSRAYYVAGGTGKDPSMAGASALVLWEAIKEAKRRGIPTFDFCGSNVPSIEKFFRGFGGELTPYFRIKKNTVLPDMLKTAKKRFGI